VFLGFSLVLLVVLGLGLWSLHTIRQLHQVNRSLLDRAVPTVRLQRMLADHLPILVRHETRAIVLRDPTYEALHRERVTKFEAHLEALGKLVDRTEATEQVRTRFAGYLRVVQQERAALREGSRDEALRLAEGPSRQAMRALEVAIEGMLGQGLAEVEQTVGAAGTLERSAQTATILSLAVTLGVGMGLAGMVVLRITRPIRALARATELVARGTYDLPVPTTSRDEVGELARAFRHMAETLQEVDRTKAEFFSQISHDLRSPLSSIQLASQLVRRDPVTPKQEHWLEIIHSSSGTLLRLTQHILDLSKIRSGMLQLDPARVDLRLLVEHAVMELQPVATDKQVGVSVALPVPSLEIVCDGERVRQVLANLLSNAIRFTPPGGEIRVEGRVEGAEVILDVADTGIGIPAAELPHVFEPYRQAHSGKGGTGLGLAIVKGLVEAHGGRVWVESREGEGSCFHVALPREQKTG
jgi:signal transduction histidine kinase